MSIRSWICDETQSRPILTEHKTEAVREAVLASLVSLSSGTVSDASLKALGDAISYVTESDPETGAVLASQAARSIGTLSRYQEYRLANRVAWAARGHDFTTATDITSPSEARFWALMRIESKRFAFDDRSMNSILGEFGSSQISADPVLSSLMAFCRIRRSASFEDCKFWVSEVLQRPDVADYNEVAYDVLAQAVWLNSSLPDQGKLLLEVCEAWRLSANHESSILHFRTASGYRLTGEYLKGIDAAERALAMLSGSSEFVRTFSEQCVRERELCVAGQSIRSISAVEAQRFDEFERELAEVERKSSTRTVEVITLFTAAAAFALGGVSTIGNEVSRGGGNPRTIVLLMSGFGGALVLFALASAMLIEITANDKVRKSKMIAIFLLVLLMFALQFGVSWGLAAVLV